MFQKSDKDNKDDKDNKKSNGSIFNFDVINNIEDKDKIIDNTFKEFNPEEIKTTYKPPVMNMEKSMSSSLGIKYKNMNSSRKRKPEDTEDIYNGFEPEFAVSFKKMNIDERYELERNGFSNEIKNINNLEFLFMQKMKNILSNISNVNKKLFKLDNKFNKITKTLNSSISKLNTKIDKITKLLNNEDNNKYTESDIGLIVEDKINEEKKDHIN